MDDDDNGTYHSESDDDDGFNSAEYGGLKWRQLREDPRHEAFNVTGLNLSQVLSVIYEVSHGINYHASRHLVKCGIHGETQARNTFNTLLKLGHYDDIAKYVRPNAVVTESLPTADSGARNERTYDPDGSLKAMLLNGWFEKGSVGENWTRTFIPCVNVDTGLTEPSHLSVFDRTAAGIKTFKSAFKRKSGFTNKRKCVVCYTSINRAFRQQVDYITKGSLEDNYADENEARAQPLTMGFIGVGYGSVPPSEETFRIPLWVKFFTNRFKGVEDLYRMVCEILPDHLERIRLWVAITALIHEFTLESVDEQMRLMFHVYSFRDFIYSIQSGRFNDLVFLARKSEEKDIKVYDNQTILTRIRNLLAMGERNDNNGAVVTLDDFDKLNHYRLMELQTIARIPEWIFVFDVVEMDLQAVSLRLEAFMTADAQKFVFMKGLFRFISFAESSRNNPWEKNIFDLPLGDSRHEYPVLSLKDFGDALIAGNYEGILTSLHLWASVLMMGSLHNRPPNFDLLVSNMKNVRVFLENKIAKDASVTIPDWIVIFNNPVSITFSNSFMSRYGANDGDRLVFKDKLNLFCVLLRDNLQKLKSTAFKRNVVPLIGSIHDFYNAVIYSRHNDLMAQIANSLQFFAYFSIDNILGNFDELLVPQWIKTFNRHLKVDIALKQLKPIIKDDNLINFRRNLVDFRVAIVLSNGKGRSDRKGVVGGGLFIDSFLQFVSAVMDRRFEDLMHQVFSCSELSRFYNVSVILTNIDRLIGEIIDDSPPVADAHIRSFLDFSDSWMYNFNSFLDDSDIVRLYSENVGNVYTDPQLRLNFTRNLGEFITELERPINDVLRSSVENRKIRKKTMRGFVEEIVHRRFPRLIKYAMDCIRESLSNAEFWRLLTPGEEFKFNPSCDLHRIILSLRMFHVKSLEMNNKVFYINSEFVTPQWVIVLTDPARESSEAAVSMYNDLLIYLTRYVEFDCTGFLRKLEMAASSIKRYSFRGVVIKSPIVTFSDFVISFLSLNWDELFATAYYNPSEDSDPDIRFQRFVVRFNAFYEICNANLRDFWNTETRRRWEARAEEEKRSMERAKKEQKRLFKDNAPAWMRKIVREGSVEKTLEFLEKEFTSFEDKFMFWKMLGYFTYKIDLTYSFGTRPASSPIVTIAHFVLAVFNKRFDNLLFYVHTFCDGEEGKSKLKDVFFLVLKNCEKQAIEHGYIFGDGFMKWKSLRERAHPPRADGDEQDIPSESSVLTSDPMAVELSDWSSYRPDNFEALVDDDSEEVGAFRWVFDLVEFTGYELSEYSLRLKDVDRITKTRFFENLPIFISAMEKFRQTEGKFSDHKHKKVLIWRDFLIAVSGGIANLASIEKILSLCEGKRVGNHRFRVSIASVRLREMYDNLKQFMENITPTKTEFESSLVIFREKEQQLVTHKYPTSELIVQNSIQNFVVKKPSGSARDSLFECIKDSMSTLLISGIKPHLLYFPPFFKTFQQDADWCDIQRRQIFTDLLNTDNDIQVYDTETRSKIVKKVSDVVAETYFHGKTEEEVKQSILHFTDMSMISEEVEPGMMQLIADRFNLTIYVTRIDNVKKVRRKRSSKMLTYVPKDSQTSAARGNSDEIQPASDSGTDVTVYYESNDTDHGETDVHDGDDSFVYDEIPDSVVFKPSKDRLPWETSLLYDKRYHAFQVNIFLKYSRKEKNADGTTYTGYQTLLAAEMTEVFNISKIGNVMQRNVVDMLWKFQKQCTFNSRGFYYTSKVFNIRSLRQMEDVPFIPLHNFFIFPVQIDFIRRLGSDTDSRASNPSQAKENMQRGWMLFKQMIDGHPPPDTVTQGSALEQLLNVVIPNLKCFEFNRVEAVFMFREGTYWLKGSYDYSVTEKNWRNVIYYQDKLSGNGSVFDSVQITRSDNKNAPSFASDLVFESVHLPTDVRVENEAQFYLKCVWVSLLSYLYHSSVPNIPSVALTKEQYYFLCAIVALQTTPQQFCTFVRDLCQRKKNDLDGELSTEDAEKASNYKTKLGQKQACEEVIQQLDPQGNPIEFQSSHKMIIATVLNLFIVESEFNQDMKLSRDRAHFVVNICNDFVGSDSFYINSNVFPSPDLLKDPTRFMIRRDFTPVGTSDHIFTVKIEELEYLQDYHWRAGAHKSFFQCVADTCFVLEEGDSKAKKYLYANHDGQPDEHKVRKDLIHILNRIFEWYCQGKIVEERMISSSAHGGETPLISINESFFKIKSIITSIVDFHWKYISSSLHIGSFDGVVTVEIWDAFLKLMADEEYSPSLFEMQVLADYLGVTICVFSFSGITTLNVKIDYVDGKKVPFVFIPIVKSKMVLSLIDTQNGSFKLMSPSYKENGSVVEWAQPFIVSKTPSERFRSITCMRDVASVADYNECLLVLNNNSTSFYIALSKFIQARDIPIINIFKHYQEISTDAYHKIVDTYLFGVTEIFIKFFPGSDAIGVHESIQEIGRLMKNDSKQGGKILKSDVVSHLKKYNSAMVQVFSTRMYGDTAKEDLIMADMDAIDSTPVFQAQFHAVMASDDFEKRGGRQKILEKLDGQSNILHILLTQIGKWLKNVRSDVRKIILYHHYGRLLVKEREQHQGKDDGFKLSKLEDELWKTYYEGEFMNKIPSEFEFEQVAKILKVLLIVLSDPWTRSVKRLLKFKGAHEHLYDCGLNTTTPLVILIGAKNTFSMMAFRAPVAQRNETQNDDASGLKYQNLLMDSYTKSKKNVKLLKDGKWKVAPKTPILYKLIGVPPNASMATILSNVETGRLRKSLKMIFPDKLALMNNGSMQFKPIFDDLGPQTLDELNEMIDFFNSNLGISADKVYDMLDLAWQTVSDPNYRFIYHVHGIFIPLSKRISGFKPKPVSNQGNSNDSDGEEEPGLGINFEKWSFDRVDEDGQSLTEGSGYYQNYVPRIPVYIQVKDRYPSYIKLDMRTSDEKQWDFGGILSNELRDIAIDDFMSRFNVSRQFLTSNSDLSSNIYAAMIPVRKSSSDIKCELNEYKAYITPLKDGVYDSRVSVVSVVLHGEIPDMKTQAVSKESDFEAKAKWSNNWCGLKMCIQTAFFFARNDSFFIKYINEHIGDKDDLMRFDWLRKFLTQDQIDDWSVYKNDGKEINFSGITNPYHVNYSTLKDVIHILFKTSEGGHRGEHNENIQNILSRGEQNFRTTGVWDTDDNISVDFDKIDFDEADSDGIRSIKKRDKSFLLMRLLGMAFNVNFVVVSPFTGNDVNSLTLSDECFYYYTVKESGNTVKVKDLSKTFIKRRGLYWCNHNVPSGEIYKQKLLSVDGHEYAPTQACPLPVFVIWENDKWNILRLVSFHNVGIKKELALKKYNEKKELREKVEKQKEKAYGKDWKGPTQPSIPNDNNSDPGFGHFSANDCNQGDSDSDRSDGFYDSGSEDSEDDWWDEWEDSDSDEEDDEHDYGRSVRRWQHPSQPRTLWGGNMPRYAPSYRSEHGGGSSEGGNSVPGGRRWETARTSDRFFININGPNKDNLYRMKIRRRDTSLSARHVSYNEDQKEIHFMSQKVPMAVNILKFLSPYGCCDLKLQLGQMEQTKILAIVFACCFDKATIVPIKRCYTTRMVVACKGLRKDIVNVLRVRQLLKTCFDLNEGSFHNVLSHIYQTGVVPPERIDNLMKQAQSASDELWADDFRCSLVLARSYIQATLEGKVSPAPDYLSPELANMLNTRVFSKVTLEQRRMNQEMIRTLMNSNIADQILPLFRVVFHPDLHTWRLTLPKHYKRTVHSSGESDNSPKYWQWDRPAAAATAFTLRRPLP